MNKKAIILDLDNTIYPVSSIGNELFAPLFKLITDIGEYDGDIEMIKKDVMRMPFQKVAGEYKFSSALTEDGIRLLNDLTYDKEIHPFEDYDDLRNIPCKKFLVTTGFTKMQQSKIKQLRIEQDFEEVHIVDPQLSNKTKKDIFKEIQVRRNLTNSELLVVGDDTNSEIQAAKELGIPVALYDKMNFNPGISDLPRITSFKQLYDLM